MLLYIMLYIVLAYLMLFAALSNAVCLHNASFLPMLFIFMFCLGLLTHSLLISEYGNSNICLLEHWCSG